MGSIRVRTNTGKLFLDFSFQGVRCREHTLLDDTPTNRKRLKLVMDKIEREISLGIFNYAKRFPGSPKAQLFDNESKELSGIPLFSEFTSEWLQENEFRWKRSGRINIHNILDKHILPRFGSTHVNAITKGDILKFRAYIADLPGRKGAKMSPKRVNNIMQPFSSILNEAAERFGFVSPFNTIKNLKGVRPDVRPFSLTEVQKIIDHIRPEYRNYMIVRFFTGMRSGEIHGLRWKNIDFNREVIKVVESLTYGEIDSPKTVGSIREIRMSPKVYDALIDQQESNEGDSEYVFVNKNGGPLDATNLTKRIWYPLLKKLNIDPRRPYQTRHTAASLWLASGENPEWVAHQLGHQSTQMLFQVYSRYIPNATRNDGSAFDKLIDQVFAENKEMPDESE